MQKKSSIVFLLSDFHAPNYEEALRRLSFRHDVIAVYNKDQLEDRFVHAGLVEFIDPESGHKILCDTSDKMVTTRIQASFAEHREQTRSLVARSGADFLTIDTHPIRELAHFMDRRLARFH